MQLLKSKPSIAVRVTCQPFTRQGTVRELPANLSFFIYKCHATVERFEKLLRSERHIVVSDESDCCRKMKRAVRSASA